MSNTRQIVNDASMGDPEAISALAQRLDAATSPEAIAGQVAGIVTAQAQAREAANRFREKNADLFDGGFTQRALMQEDVELSQLRPGMALEERFALAAKQTRAWLAEQRSGTTPSSPDRPTATRSRRAALPQASRTGAQRTSEGWDTSDDGPPEEDVGDVIGRMAAARGKRPVWHPRFETDVPPVYVRDHE